MRRSRVVGITSTVPDGEDTGFKYAALVFAPPGGPRERVIMYGGKETFQGKLLSLIPEDERSRWREWVGSVAWDKIARAERIVIERAASSAPSVLDADDKRLREHMRTAWVAFMLTGANYGDDPPWVVSGEASGDGVGSPLLTLRSAGEQDRIVRPFYWQRPKYVQVAQEKLQEATGGRWPDESWFPLWVEVDELLSRRTPKPPLIGYALRSYWSARTQQFLEFSIPGYVRAAEGVIALERRMGSKVFSKRALRLVPSLAKDKYVGANAEALLPKLYQLRSDCVHGKLPFRDLEARGEEGRDEAAQLAYVAEVLAREALLLALRYPDWSVFERREVLEAAWARGAFPGAAGR